MNVLVLGGTQFFGQKSVGQLLEHGHQVTIATRGNKSNPFESKADHILLDAQDASHPGWEEVQAQQWDAVFDNICYTAKDAEIRIEKLTGNTDHYYVTSSMAVYTDDKDGYKETDFDPLTYQIDPNIEVTYGEGKRQIEQVLFNHAPFSVTAFRFPIVLDDDDYTERLHFYICEALQGKPIYFTHPDIKVNYVKGSQAADSIVWAIENQQSGIYNVSSSDAIPVSQLVEWLEQGTQRQAQVEYGDYPDKKSPFKTNHDQYLISDKVASDGFQLNRLEEWLPDLIRRLALEIEGESENDESR